MFFQTCAKLAFCLTQIYFLAITAWYRVYSMCFLISRNAILGFRKNMCDKQTYTALKSDPTGRTERDLNQRLLLLKKSNKISEETYKLLRSSDGLAPRLYGLPKIHKEGVPLRPIVSFVFLTLCQWS